MRQHFQQENGINLTNQIQKQIYFLTFFANCSSTIVKSIFPKNVYGHIFPTGR